MSASPTSKLSISSKKFGVGVWSESIQVYWVSEPDEMAPGLLSLLVVSSSPSDKLRLSGSDISLSPMRDMRIFGALISDC